MFTLITAIIFKNNTLKNFIRKKNITVNPIVPLVSIAISQEHKTRQTLEFRNNERRKHRSTLATENTAIKAPESWD